MPNATDPDFIIESIELLEKAEDQLIQYENAGDKDECYKVILRCLHTLKGACGMFALIDLERIFHHFEDLIIKNSDSGPLKSELIDYFLAGLDKSRDALTNNVSISYPLIDPTINKGDSSRRPLKETKKSTSKERLAYIVDDEKDVREYISTVLGQENIKCICFDDAKHALARIKQDHPDLVITDLQMPKMSGLEFIKELRKTYSLLPVLIVSAYVKEHLALLKNPSHLSICLLCRLLISKDTIPTSYLAEV